MSRIILGVFLGLAFAAIGLFWWQGRERIEAAAPPVAALPTSTGKDKLPLADASGMRGPAPPEATELTREQQRFFRYDRNRDLRITREEMLASRADGFRKLDVDGNNLLTFEEWAVTTSNRFKAADVNGDGELTQAEFAATAPKPAKKPACRC
ncbi:hypothetical protein [Caenibius sp. WL]|uniref:hypothetical protein n=1 Tax=Caenibius sp. WL TaxID=2872646 RepID=UPI001C993BE8|nr:hypothetical protein [Caenibius sp. WL]QZP07056.1 hypothetical protein K5X80_10070 [Caenibius sp. WL]